MVKLRQARNVGFVMSALSLGWMGGCVDIEPAFEATRNFDQLVEFTDIATLSLENRHGRVEITVDPGATDIRVEGTYFARSTSQSRANDAINDVEVTVAVQESQPAQLSVRLDAPADAGGNQYGADIEIVLPAGVNLVIENDDGNVTVTGNEGSVEVAGSDGQATITDQTGDVEVRWNVGVINIDSQDGSVEVDSDTGTVTIHAAPPTGGSVVGDVITGDIALEVPMNFGADLDLASTLGRIDTDFDGFEVTDLSVSAFRVTATLNGGGGTITAETLGGRVTFDGF